MTHRLLSRSACKPCVHTNLSWGERPGCHSFQVPPGNGLKPPSAVASPSDAVGTSVHRVKLPKSRPRGETAALVIMTLPDEATDVSSMWPTILQRPPGLDTCVDAVLGVRGSLRSLRRDSQVPARAESSAVQAAVGQHRRDRPVERRSPLALSGRQRSLPDRQQSRDHDPSPWLRRRCSLSCRPASLAADDRGPFLPTLGVTPRYPGGLTF